MALAAYYNEHEPFAAQWLRNLISAKLIAAGEVDDRSIADVRPDDLRGFKQCHFFAGIGGWSYALRLAGWPDDRECWTGSCPCQPFSAAGRQEGKADTRHLWPVWFPLIRECRPPVIFGEQVASSIAFGWLDEVAHDVEAEAYAIASAVLPACSVGAPHRRDRLWFVADASGAGSLPGTLAGVRGREESAGSRHVELERCSSAVADSMRSERWTATEEWNEFDGPDPGWEEATGGYQLYRSELMADAEGLRLEERIEPRTNRSQQPTAERSGIVEHTPFERRTKGIYEPELRRWWSTSASASILCGDGKRRPVEPSIRLLAHGVPARVGRLRGYGNAIVPQVAAEFIRAYMECRP